MGKCLAKAAENRYQHAEDLVVDLRNLREKLKSGKATTPRTQPPSAVPSPVVGPKRKPRLLQALFAVSTLIALTLAFVHFRKTPLETPQAPLLRFAFTPAVGLAADLRYTDVAISPNGRHIAYVAGPAGQKALWVQDLDQDEPRRIVAAGGQADNPFWSPDSEFIAFRSGDELKKVSLRGGSVVTVCRIPHYLHSSGSWSLDGAWIVFSSPDEKGLVWTLYEVPAQGGEPQVLFAPEPPEDQLLHPHSLPSEAGGRKLLYVMAKSPTEGQIVMRDLDTGRREVLASGFNPVYAPTGHIVYRSVEPAGIWAAPFSIETLQRTGEPFPIRENAYNPSVAREGTLIYLDAAEGGSWQLVWRDRSGRRLAEVIGQPQRSVGHVALSPDGRRVAVFGDEIGNTDIWIHEVDRPLKTRLTFDPADEHGPIWSPAGDRIAFSTKRQGTWDVFVKPADGAGEATALVATAAKENMSDWSRGGKYILYDYLAEDADATQDIWYLKRKDDSGGYESVPFLQTRFDEGGGSPPTGVLWPTCRRNRAGTRCTFRNFLRGAASSGCRSTAGGNTRGAGTARSCFTSRGRR